MTKIVTLAEIKKIIEASPDDELISLIETGFVKYSKGDTTVPPVGYMPFSNPPGDLHIKYGYINDDDYYVIKIASGFYENPKLGLNSSNGLMLVFNKRTGELLSILLDEGHLTDVRTALAGAVAAKYLAPTSVQAIGILGTGFQARLQLLYLKTITRCREVFVWGRSIQKANDYKNDPRLTDFHIQVVDTAREVAQHANLIVTTTPSNEPLLFTNDVKEGTHITAVGADAPGKQELESELFREASTIIVDSATQCIDHGEVCHSLKENLISQTQLIELGTFISKKQNRSKGISIADLTGVAVQDIQIAKYVYLKSMGRQNA